MRQNRIISYMERVLARRPWDDNAHNLMGYAYRQLGDYPRSLNHYQQALDLNPHHRGALEYLGEAYIAMGRLTEAHAVLVRLEAVCKQTTQDDSAHDWQTGCVEWRELKAAIDGYRARTSRE